MPQDPTFLEKEKHIKKQMNFLEQEIEDFQDMKQQKKKNQSEMKDTENKEKNLTSGRQQWLNQQIEENREKMEKLKQKLQNLEISEVKN